MGKQPTTQVLEISQSTADQPSSEHVLAINPNATHNLSYFSLINISCYLAKCRNRDKDIKPIFYKYTLFFRFFPTRLLSGLGDPWQTAQEGIIRSQVHASTYKLDFVW